MNKQIGIVIGIAALISVIFFSLDNTSVTPNIKYSVEIFEDGAGSFFKLINHSDKDISGITMTLNNEYTYTPDGRGRDRSKVGPYAENKEEILSSCIAAYDFSSFSNSRGERFDYSKIKPLTLVIKSYEGVGIVTSFGYIK